MDISDGSSDVCSSDRPGMPGWLSRCLSILRTCQTARAIHENFGFIWLKARLSAFSKAWLPCSACARTRRSLPLSEPDCSTGPDRRRSEEHTSELQSLMRISYAVFCLKKKKNHPTPTLSYTNLS